VTALAAKSLGSIADSMLEVLIGTNFTAAVDHVDIGADVWNCIAGVPGAGTKEFQLGADRDASLTNLAASINDVTRGTETVKANADGAGVMTLMFADAVGGKAIVGIPTSIALSLVGPLGATWDKDNLNESGSPSSTASASGRVTIGAAAAARIAAFNDVDLAMLPFTAGARSTLNVMVLSATGLVKACDDLFELTGNLVSVVGAAGAVPLIATDVVHWSVIGG